ncbi:MAG TPA: type II secretion system protein GspG [Leptospiraceae bacterium]|nr:type II secretion system protein GspG [Leptospiraceae bacterium]HMW08260.1 type II secretion system protein GspG [Leptospiraceae bacterium]HMY34026.1 type II secretion system protein GspG [Leptospiraceae bacterium]HMZ66320.1 type II secretion system protein GspG [Leptospiraceae bacterium]HNA09437.1 type II secretion system protein GspG [Leptospiraceae bacterium]
MKLNRFSKLSKKLKRGMTLVELSVVVLILGAIIALVAFNINPGEIQDQTAALKLKKDAQELQIALEKYADAYGKMPSEDQGILALVEKPTSGDVPENYKPILNKKNAVLDPWKTPYKLKVDSNGDYGIFTLGKDKKEGGEGKNADFNIMKEDEYPKEFQKNK